MTVGSQVKGCYSSIKGAEATLELLINKTTDKQSKQLYAEMQQIISEIKADLKQQVIHLTNEEPQYK